MRKDYIIFADFENWQIDIITGEPGEQPVRPKHIVRYVIAYLRYGKGSLIHRVNLVLTKLCTRTLKPSQVESSK